MADVRINKLAAIRTVIIGLFVCLAGYGLLYPRLTAKTYGGETAAGRPAEQTPPAGEDAAAAGYSEFPHNIKAHQKNCDACHKFPSDNWRTVRKADEAFPDVTDYPKHPSCLGCHRKQFFGTPKPVICKICHTNPGPRNSNRYPFPNPREIFDKSEKGKRAVSDFIIYFPHPTHVDLFGENRQRPVEKSDGRAAFVRAGFRRAASEDSCANCHQTYLPQGDSDDEYVTPPPKNLGDGFWLKKGTFKTVPIGHTTCFTCHSADSGLTPAPSDCATCHKLKPAPAATDFDAKAAAAMKIDDKRMLDAWRRRDSSATFRHEWFAHVELECSTCHTVGEINTLKPETKIVSINACAICHVTATSDDGGAVNYEVDSRTKDPKFACTKCHISYGRKSIPKSHLDAIAAQGEE